MILSDTRPGGETNAIDTLPRCILHNITAKIFTHNPIIVRHSGHPSLGAERFLILAIADIRSFMPYFRLASILKNSVEVYQSCLVK